MKGAGTLSSIRHVDVVVSSTERSLKFYRGLLGPLGWKLENTIEGERGELITYLAGPGGFACGAIGFRQRQSKNKAIPLDRYDIGLHHLAINTSNRKDVDDCAAWLKKSGYQIEDGPAEFYNEHYYAIFFYDPDGMKLEIVCGL